MTKQLGFWSIFIMNVALVMSIIYTIALLPFAYLKGLYPVYIYLISIGVVISYIVYWKVQLKDERIKTPRNLIRKAQL